MAWRQCVNPTCPWSKPVDLRYYELAGEPMKCSLCRQMTCRTVRPSSGMDSMPGGLWIDSTMGGLHPDFVAYHKAHTPGYIPPTEEELAHIR